MKKIFSILLSIFMLVTVLPVTLVAEEVNGVLHYNDKAGKASVKIEEYHEGEDPLYTNVTIGEGGTFSTSSETTYRITLTPAPGCIKKEIQVDYLEWFEDKEVPDFVLSTEADDENKIVLQEGENGTLYFDITVSNDTIKNEISIWWWKNLGEGYYSYEIDGCENDFSIELIKDGELPDYYRQGSDRNYRFAIQSNDPFKEYSFEFWPNQGDVIEYIDFNDEHFPNEEGWGPFTELENEDGQHGYRLTVSKEIASDQNIVVCSKVFLYAEFQHIRGGIDHVSGFYCADFIDEQTGFAPGGLINENDQLGLFNNEDSSCNQIDFYVSCDAGYKPGLKVKDVFGGDLNDGVSVNVEDKGNGLFLCSIQANYDIGSFNVEVDGVTKDAKSFVENMKFAYAGNKAQIEEYLEKELWYRYFGKNGDHINDFYDASVFASIDDLKNAVTVNDPLKNDKQIVIENKVNKKLDYYEFSLKFDNSNIATGKVYVLDNSKNVVVEFEKEDHTKIYQLIDDATKGWMEDKDIVSLTENYAVDSNGSPLVRAFGNGGEIANAFATDQFGGRYVATFRISSEYTNNPCGTNIGAKLVVYKNLFEGVRIKSNESKIRAGAWDDASTLSVFPTNETNDEALNEVNIFVAGNPFKVSKVEDGGSLNLMKTIECTLENSDRGVDITGINGEYTIESLSGFYDKLPLKVTYNDDKEGFINLNLVALNVYGARGNGDDHTHEILHGAGSGDNYKIDLTNGDVAIVGVFYNPEVDSTDEVVLYVTYTWSNGSVTHEKITRVHHSDKVIEDPGHPETSSVWTQADDFIIWRGKEDNAPVKVECTPVNNTTTQTSFGGAIIGSGAGVVWENDFRD